MSIYINIYVDETVIAFDQGRREQLKKLAQGSHKGTARQCPAHKGPPSEGRCPGSSSALFVRPTVGVRHGMDYCTSGGGVC